jgi:hypothetical protein
MPVAIIAVLVLVFLFFKGKASASASVSSGGWNELDAQSPNDPYGYGVTDPQYDPGPGDAVGAYGNMADTIMQAIYQFEGGRPGNRNVVNNNDGNLRSDPNAIGSAGGYAVFADRGDGIDALNGWLNRHIQAHPGWDFYDLFGTYAPRSDNNNPDAYAEYVANYAGVDPSQTVSSVWGS